MSDECRTALTHDELVDRAVRWLENSCRCKLVLREPWNSGEMPDAIGWGLYSWAKYGSVVIECKTSRGDFFGDRRKYWRLRRGLGRFRYYLVPPGLLRGLKLPALWGLLECHATQIRSVVRAREIPLGWWNHSAEMALLIRHAMKGQRMMNAGMNAEL